MDKRHFFSRSPETAQIIMMRTLEDSSIYAVTYAKFRGTRRLRIITVDLPLEEAEAKFLAWENTLLEAGWKAKS